MTHRTDAPPIEESAMLVAFCDLSGFGRYSRSVSDRSLLDTMAEYFELVGDIVEGSGGRVVKFIGDAALIVYPEDLADAGVRALLELKGRGDAWMEERGIPCRHEMKAHVGPVVCGHVGTRRDKRFDVFGQTVNTAAVTKSNGVAITPQAFRKLAPGTRTLFKKHTPPVTYIPVEERHRD
ncbi:MAG: adenylate/guanylate cyclase domain-containing protein [Elusimicrobia bacterium]|nr:adenylate/guanylate cyclase domain-containing protein [Elusimicrobiota bacterium]